MGKGSTIKIKRIGSKYLLQIFMCIMIILCAFMIPGFATAKNVVNIMSQVAFNAIIATGMTFVILIGDIDLSAGAVGALSGMIVSYFVLMLPEITIFQSILLIFGVSIIIGILIGSIIGFSIAKLAMPPMIATLAVQMICRGFAYIMNDGSPYYGLADNFKFLGVGKIFNIPIVIFLMILVLIVGDLFLRKTVTGRRIYAVGSNSEVATLSGIHVIRTKIFVHIVASTLAALAGALYASKLLTGQPNACDGYELTAVASVAIGGTSMRGGRGGVANTVIGIIAFGVINNGMNLLHISSYWQTVVTGIIIAVAVISDTYFSRK